MSDPAVEAIAPLKFGTRGSALARAQTALAVARFHTAHPDRPIDIRIISTEGDRDKTSPLSEIGGRGVFTNAIQSALLRGEIEAAVHSAKDLPSILHPTAPIVAFPDRDDPRDVLVSRHGTTLDRLPVRPVIGTSSRRREAQIRHLRPDARIVNLRGNIDTRLARAERHELDAIVLAAAGIHRLGGNDRITQYFAVEEVVPSPAQGAIAIQALLPGWAADELRAIDDPAVSLPVGIERAFLAAVGAGCTWPVGAYARETPSGYRLLAMLADESAEHLCFADDMLTVGEERPHAAEIALRLRHVLGNETRPRAWPGHTVGGGDLEGARIVVTRPRRQAGPLIAALAARGAEPVPLPTIRIEPVADLSPLDAPLRDATRGDVAWIVFTSANAVEVVAGHMATLGITPDDLAGASIGVVGAATAEAVAAAGLTVAHVPAIATAEALANDLTTILRPGSRVLYPRSAIGRDALPETLRDAGVDVVTIAVYQTLPEADIAPEALNQVRRGEVDLITFASPSSVRNFLALLGDDHPALGAVPVVCAGPATAHAARDAAFAVVAVSDDPGAMAMTEAIAAYLHLHVHWFGRRDVEAAEVVPTSAWPALSAQERSVG